MNINTRNINFYKMLENINKDSEPDYEDTSTQSYLMSSKKNDKFNLNLNSNNLDRIDEYEGNELEPWAD